MLLASPSQGRHRELRLPLGLLRGAPLLPLHPARSVPRTGGSSTGAPGATAGREPRGRRTATRRASRGCGLEVRKTDVACAGLGVGWRRRGYYATEIDGLDGWVDGFVESAAKKSQQFS